MRQGKKKRHADRKEETKLFLFSDDSLCTKFQATYKRAPGTIKCA